MKKRIAILSGAVAAAGLSTPSAWANLLVDPGFEVPVATAASPNGANGDTLLPTSQAGAALNPTFPWYGLLTNAGDQAEISSDIPPFLANTSDRINSGLAADATTTPQGNLAHSGDQYDYAFTAGRPSGTVGGAAQLVSFTGTVGDLVQGSAYFFVKADNATDGDRFQAGGSNDTVQLIFENSTGTQIGTTVVSSLGGDLGKVDSTSTQNTWVQVSTAPTAVPVGTTQILMELALTRGASGGVQFGDDADLEDLTQNAIPEPASLGLLGSFALLTLRNRRRNV